MNYLVVCPLLPEVGFHRLFKAGGEVCGAAGLELVEDLRDLFRLRAFPDEVHVGSEQVERNGSVGVVLEDGGDKGFHRHLRGLPPRPAVLVVEAHGSAFVLADYVLASKGFFSELRLLLRSLSLSRRSR